MREPLVLAIMSQNQCRPTTRKRCTFPALRGDADPALRPERKDESGFHERRGRSVSRVVRALWLPRICWSPGWRLASVPAYVGRTYYPTGAPLARLERT